MSVGVARSPSPVLSSHVGRGGMLAAAASVAQVAAAPPRVPRILKGTKDLIPWSLFLVVPRHCCRGMRDHDLCELG